MKILAVGDSFTFGEELSDRSKSWPHQLANFLNCEVSNLGCPGASNNAILRRAILNETTHDVVIICWSIFHRTEWADQLGTFDIWPGYMSKLNRADNTKHRCELGDYLTKYHDDKFLYNEYLMKIISAQSYFKSQNKKYLMFDAFGNTQERKIGDQRLLNKVDENFFVGWPHNSIMEWVDGIPNMRAPKGHLSEEGQLLVADKIYEYIRNLGWVS